MKIPLIRNIVFCAAAVGNAVSASASSLVVQGPITVGNDDDLTYADQQGIATSGAVQILDGGMATFVTDGDSKIVLNPGFRAKPNSNGLFHALATNDTSVYNAFYSLMVDGDQDGMLDALELLYGLDPFLNDASGDIDGDGVSNGAEIAAGTDPMASNDWYGVSSVPSGPYGTNPVYIVDPDGIGHDVNTSDLTVD